MAKPAGSSGGPRTEPTEKRLITRREHSLTFCNGRRRICRIFHVPGLQNPADALTKYITDGGKQRFLEYMARLYNCDLESLRQTS